MKVHLCGRMAGPWFYFSLLLAVSTAGDLKSLEVCNQRRANFSCPQHEVILIHKAEYGRMGIGVCVQRDLGYLGCRVSVLATLDKLCSGKQTCSFFLPKPDVDIYENSKMIQGYQRCPDDTTSYLAISYVCVNVLPQPTTPCIQAIPLPDTVGFLSPLPNTLLGSHMCPFTLKAADGQHFDIKLFVFNRENIQGSHTCKTFADIQEKSGTKEVSTCEFRGVTNREKFIYSSQGSTVDITFTSAARQLTQVLIKYEVSGCANITTSRGQTFKRNGLTAELTCNKGSSEDKSFLQCKGTEWFGYKNCSSDAAPMATGSDGEAPPTTFPIGLVLVVAIGVGLGIFLGGVMLICVNIYMKRKHRHNYAEPDYDIHDMDYHMQVSHQGKPSDLGGQMQHHLPPSLNTPPNRTATLIPQHNSTEETLISISGPRCAKHCSPHGGPAFDEVTMGGGNIDDLTKTSFMLPYKGDKLGPLNITGPMANKGRERDHIF